MLVFDLLLNVPISCFGTDPSDDDDDDDENESIDEIEQRKNNNQKTMEKCKIAGEKMKTIEYTHTHTKKEVSTKWNVDCKKSASTRCAIMSTNSAN